MHSELSLQEVKKEWHGSLRSYVVGLIISLILTSTSFILVATNAFPEKTLIYSIVGLGLSQAIFQLIFFLHLGKEPKPRWETYIFYFMVLILLIIVIGSLWVMNDLNERMMPNMEGMNHD